MALTETQLAQLADHGIESEEEFNGLRKEDQEALLADTPDDTKPAPSDTPKPTEAPAGEPDKPIATPEPTAPPVATPAPTPAPTAAPGATPAPTAAPVATPAPTEAPKAWRAVDPLGLPQVADPEPPPVVATKEDAAKKTELKGKLDELFDQFAEGSLTKEDYQRQKAAIEGELDDVNGRLTAQRSLDAQYEASIGKSWNNLVLESFRIAKECGGIDYGDPASKDAAADLDATVKRLAQAAPLMHPGKPSGWLDRWALAEAHKQVAEKYGKPFVVPQAGTQQQAQDPAKPAATTAPRAAPDLSKVPPTLRNTPSAADANLSVDEFAEIDAMTPADAERAVARMPKEQLDRYLSR